MIAIIDKVHTAACDRLIPFAEKATDHTMGLPPKDNELKYQKWCADWTRLYMRTMTRYKKEARLKVYTREEVETEREERQVRA